MPDGREEGFVTVQHVAAVALTLVLLAQLTNLLVVAYARGAVRAALDEGARAAAVAGADPGECEARAAAVLRDLLGGPLGDGVGPVRCADEAQLVTARADSAFPAWFPGVPDMAFSTTASAIRDGAP